MRNNTNRWLIWIGQNKGLLWLFAFFIGIFIFVLYEDGVKLAKASGTSYPVYFLASMAIGAAGSILGALLFLVAISNYPDLMVSKVFHKDEKGIYIWLHNPTNIPVRIAEIISSEVHGDRSKVRVNRSPKESINYLDLFKINEKREFGSVDFIYPGNAIKIYITQDISKFIQVEFIFSYAIDFRQFHRFICINNPAAFNDDVIPDFFKIENFPNLRIASR